jgi:hypothetical protein
MESQKLKVKIKKFGILVILLCVLAWPVLAAKTPTFNADAAYGKLTVYSDVIGSDIYVDAKYVGQDRATISTIPAGKHYVRVVKDDKDIKNGIVEVKEGEETIIVAKPNEELMAKMRKPNHVLLFGGMTAVGYNVTTGSSSVNLAYRPQYGVGTEVKFVLPVIDVNLDLGFSLNYPSAITLGTGEVQMAITSPYVAVGKDLFRSGPLKVSAGLGLNYGVFNPGGGTTVSVASRFGYLAYVEALRQIAEGQKLAVKTGYVSYNGRSSGGGDVTCAGYFLQMGMAYQL